MTRSRPVRAYAVVAPEGDILVARIAKTRARAREWAKAVKGRVARIQITDITPRKGA